MCNKKNVIQPNIYNTQTVVIVKKTSYENIIILSYAQTNGAKSKTDPGYIPGISRNSSYLKVASLKLEM